MDIEQTGAADAWCGCHHSGRPPLVLSLDGEREHVFCEACRLSVRLNLEGPKVVVVKNAMQLVLEMGIFLSD
jgi:hypothetical protein